MTPDTPHRQFRLASLMMLAELVGAGLSTFDLSRYMGASLTMIDRHYGHLARDGRQHVIDLLDRHAVDAGGRPVNTASASRGNALSGYSRE
jgi:hypothetical protein